MKINWKFVGTVATIGSAILGFVISAAEDKKTEETIKEEVAKAVKEATKH